MATGRRSSALTLAAVLLTAVIGAVGLRPAPATADAPLGGWYALSWDRQPDLFRIDQATGEATLVASATSDVTTNGIAAFDVDGTTGMGYFFSFDWGVVSELWSIDLTTGTFTRIGEVTGVKQVVSFDIGIDGEFWVYADETPGTGQPGFGRVDPATAQFTPLGAGPERLAALGSDADGELIGIAYSDTVYRYDAGAGTWTEIGEVPSSVLAGDFDADGALLVQGWSGGLDRIDLGTTPPTVTRVFTFSGDWTPATGGEAFAVAGPSDGRTLAQAIAGVTPGGGAAPVAPGPSWVPTTGGAPTLTPGVGQLQRPDRSTLPLSTSSPAPGQVRYAADGISVTFTGAPGTGAGTGLVATPSGTVECEICAFLAAGGVIEAWMFSEPRLVAAWRIEDLPCQRFTIPVGAPLDGGAPLPTGTHTLQLVLPTDGGLQAVNVGVTVGAVRPTAVRAGMGPAGADGSVTALGWAPLLVAAGAGSLLLRRGRRRLTAA